MLSVAKGSSLSDMAQHTKKVKAVVSRLLYASLLSHVYNLLIAKRQIRNRNDKETPKGGSVYSERGVPLQVSALLHRAGN